ncbi:hypothetical protein H2200_001158 [Cladophialophora chaetospira]|uniref:BTB domain-containing protein n=1 Tax=Cladophialophora chaetospira TaxID=386627 RepID=A0AA39CNT1_9EURO|nr:hypothetical protein H2200_001158 [Cladophialophora chaetospira]
MTSTIDECFVTEVAAGGDLILRVGRDHPAGPSYLRVSSTVLTLTIPFFNALLNGHFQESKLQLNDVDPPVLDLPEDDGAYMLKLCQILHPSTRDADHLILPKSLVEISVITNKYRTQHTSSWLSHRHLHPDFPVVTNEMLEVGQLVQAAYYFENPRMFYLYTRQALITIGPERRIFEQGLGEVLAEDFSIVFDKMRVSLFRQLRKKSLSVLGEWLMADQANRSHRTNLEFIPDYYEELTRLTKLDEPEQRISQSWYDALDTTGLEHVDNLRKTVEETLKMLFKSALCERRHTRPHHIRAEDNWIDNLVRKMIIEFRTNVAGMCLTCFKTGAYSGKELVAGECQKHPIALPPLLLHRLRREDSSLAWVAEFSEW